MEGPEQQWEGMAFEILQRPLDSFESIVDNIEEQLLKSLGFLGLLHFSCPSTL